MITLPIVLFAAIGVYVSWRMDVRVPLVICTVVFGYALATSPLADGINRFGSGVSTAIHDASHTKSDTSVPANYSTTPRSHR